MTKAFLIEWAEGVPGHVDGALVDACLFTDNHMVRKRVKIRDITYPDEVQSVDYKSEFNKMASTKYIHVDNVVHMLREVVEEVSYVGNRGRVLEMVNDFLKNKGIDQRLAVDWKIVVVPVEAELVVKEKDD